MNRGIARRWRSRKGPLPYLDACHNISVVLIPTTLLYQSGLVQVIGSAGRCAGTVTGVLARTSSR